MRKSDWILLWTLSLLWGGSFLFVELALEGLAPLSIVWARVALAAMLLGAILCLTGQALPTRAVWPALLVMGLLNNAIPFTLIVTAQTGITGALASVLNATTPIFTVLIAHLATRDDRLTAPKLLGVAFGFTGVLVMMAGGHFHGALPMMLACLGAALSYGMASVWGRRFRATGISPMATAFGQVAASTVLLAPVWLWVDQPWQLGRPGTGPILAVLGLAGLSTALAYIIFFRILASAGATAISLVTFLVPLSAAGLGWAVLGERLEVRHLGGMALILTGLAVIERGKRLKNV